MPTLTLTVGLPGSGKTTWAVEELERLDLTDTSGAIVSRDGIRDMFRYGWTGGPEAEERVTAVQVPLVEILLRQGVTVIVDDTNLPYWDGLWRVVVDPVDRWRLIAIRRDVKMVVHRMDTPLEECIRRDALRPVPVPGGPISGCQVGEEVIRRIAGR